MNVRKYLLSCAAIAISGGVLSFAVQQANAQPADDFFAPPVVENVTEIELPEVDAPDAMDEMDAMQDIALPEFPEDDIANTSPENLGEFLPDVDADAMVEPEVVSEDLPAFPEVDGIGEGLAETSIPAPAPVENTADMAPTVAIPAPQLQAQSNDMAPGGAEALKAISGESKGAVQPSTSFEDIEEKYYSADRGVTTSDLNAPTKADPSKDPAQRIVVIDRVSTVNSVDARFVAAQRALDLRRYDAALQMFEDLYVKNPRDQRVLMGRAVALQMTGHEEKAIQAYEELLDLTPKNPKVLVNMMGLIAKQYPAVALERLKGLYEKNPGNAAIVAQMGLAEAKLHNYSSAERYIGIASSIEPHNPQHYYNLAVVYDSNKDYGKAIKHYERALEVDAVSGGNRIKREVVYDRLSRLRNM